MSNDTDNMQTTQSGSLTRITIGGAPAPEPTLQDTPYEASRVARGVTRFEMGQDSAPVTQGVTRYAVGQEKGTSVMGTLKTGREGPTVELLPGVPGSRTLLKVALSEGLIEPAGNGEYRDRGQTAGPANSEEGAPDSGPEEALVDPGKGVFDSKDDEDWNAAIEPLPQFAYDRASASVTNAVLSGADSLAGAAKALAEQAGIAPDLAENYVTTGYEMYEGVVAKTTAGLGITPELKPAFYDWLRDSKGKALQSAISSLTAGRDVAPFRNLAVEFLRSQSPQAKALKGRY